MSKIRRNQSCPCGSGKKFKHCCGRIKNAAAQDLGKPIIRSDGTGKRVSSVLSPPPDCLVVFLDETGHERLPDGHTYYGIGGCAVTANDYERLIAHPWRDFRADVTGNRDSRLHAAQFGRVAASANLEACASFFRNNHFMRLGTVGTVATQIFPEKSDKRGLTIVPDEEHLAWAVIRTVPQRILDVAKHTLFQSIAVIVEKNPRSRRLLQAALGDMGVQENGRKLPVNFYEMDKTSGEPGLEVADFIANAIAGHARHSLVADKPGFRRDFEAIFHSVDSRLASFIGITKIDFGETPAAASQRSSTDFDQGT